MKLDINGYFDSLNPILKWKFRNSKWLYKTLYNQSQSKPYLYWCKNCANRKVNTRQKNAKFCGHDTLKKWKLCKNLCKFILTQQSANNFDGKVKYCGLKIQGNSIHPKIKKQLIYAASHFLLVVVVIVYFTFHAYAFYIRPIFSRTFVSPMVLPLLHSCDFVGCWTSP